MSGIVSLTATPIPSGKLLIVIEIRTIHENTMTFQEHSTSWANIKLAARKGETIDPTINQFKCDECGRVYLSNAGTDNHKKGNIGIPTTNYKRWG